MKISKIILAIILVLIFSCSGKVNKSDKQVKQIEKEIQQLEEPKAKSKYLEKILEDDQKVRNGDQSAKLVAKYGIDSPEYKEYVQNQWKQDKINLIKIEKYLEFHGYPNKQMSEKATTALWMVIHHAQGYQVRERNFKIIYEAYLTGKIDENAISFYLGRMYKMKNGERLKMESPYQMKDEINQLIKGLNLENEKAEVHKRVEKKKLKKN